MKAFTTSARSFRIWIIKDEFTFDLIIYKVHLCPNDKHECLFVDYNSHTLVLNYLIEFANLVFFHVIHDIWVTVATTSAHVYSHSKNVCQVILILHQFLYSISCMLRLKQNVNKLFFVTINKALFFSLGGRLALFGGEKLISLLFY